MKGQTIDYYQYCVDEILVGKDIAAERWEVWDNKFGWIPKRSFRFRWSSAKEFRRKKDAPNDHPAEDWRSAPTGAEFRSVSRNGTVAWWQEMPEYDAGIWVGKSILRRDFCGVSHPVHPIQAELQKCPPQAWFDLGPQVVDTIIEPEPQSSDEGTPAAELHELIAQAIREHPKDWFRYFEGKNDNGGYNPFVRAIDVYTMLQSDLPIRPVPLTESVTDSAGNEWHFPRPLQEAPEPGTRVWRVSPFVRVGARLSVWGGGSNQQNWLKAGLLQATPKGATDQARAMVAMSGGDPDYIHGQGRGA